MHVCKVERPCAVGLNWSFLISISKLRFSDLRATSERRRFLDVSRPERLFEQRLRQRIPLSRPHRHLPAVDGAGRAAEAEERREDQRRKAGRRRVHQLVENSESSNYTISAFLSGNLTCTVQKC
jgi:hypothetical protein